MDEMLFANKCVKYETFVHDVAKVVTKMVVEQLRNQKEYLSQNEAFRRFGRGNVERWLRECRLEPMKVSKGKKEYRLTDLLTLQNVQQDYLF